jgi:hypothetical protein
MGTRGSALVLLGVLVSGCGDYSTPTVAPTPTPTPTPTPGPGDVVAGGHTGPTAITFLTAEPAPGSTIDGCGRDASGCAGRVRMRFRLLSTAGGPVLYATAFLHATTKIACERGTTGALELAPGVPTEILIVFDQPDPACGVPATISNMKLVVEGPVQTASLQEWAIRYELRP